VVALGLFVKLFLHNCEATTLGSGYGYNGKIRTLRAPNGDLSHLDDGGHIFLDYAGTGLYTKSQVGRRSTVRQQSAVTVLCCFCSTGRFCLKHAHRTAVCESTLSRCHTDRRGRRQGPLAPACSYTIRKALTFCRRTGQRPHPPALQCPPQRKGRRELLRSHPHLGRDRCLPPTRRVLPLAQRRLLPLPLPKPPLGDRHAELRQATRSILAGIPLRADGTPGERALPGDM